MSQTCIAFERSNTVVTALITEHRCIEGEQKRRRTRDACSIRCWTARGAKELSQLGLNQRP
uniref:Uncharacterized protein n=1 Tax=Hyaloperonospora arabidopsidis (strain Emoy2) TaxID=559515 RepID=M4BAT2_HYAAE